MRIVAISDTHGKFNQVQVPDGNVLVHAGDWTRSDRDIHETKRFAEWFNSHPHPYKIAIAGNHDRLLERMTREQGWALLFPAIYLFDSGATIDGVKFWGSPYTPEFCDWAFNEPRGEAIQKHWDMIPNDTNVLITHGPPYGLLDTTTRLGDPLGCLDLRNALERVKPRLHIFGHIHGGYGIHTDIGCNNAGEDEEFISVNAAVMNEAYKVVNAAHVIDI